MEGTKVAEPADRNAIAEDWYGEKRREVEAYFVDDNRVVGSEAVHMSPSGKYRLVVIDCDGKQRWDFSRGMVYRGDQLIADVKRNYGIFHFGWAEGHPNGHDYLLCGEDYQGQTVIELDTGKRQDYIHESAHGGGGFCCAAYYPSPDRKLIVIDGCVWAAPYELLFRRFDDPMSLPWPLIDRATGEPQGWTEDGFVFESSDDIRLTDLKPYDEFTEAEEEEFWKRRREIGGQRIRRYQRRSDGSTLLLAERVVPSAGKA
jgi:hypothetical protein